MDALKKISEFAKFGSILGLERMNELMARLGDPQKDLKVIHVAGTNGKGSVCRFIYEVLRANGYSAGLYTSPFIEDFCERIENDGEKISEEALERCTLRVVEKAEEMIASGSDSPTEFEIVTAIAFLYFSMERPDFVVMEVGLGGRGDSTNIIEAPLISVITSISYDHMDRLGNTLEEIAREKAGIIKKKVPVVINVKDKGAARVIAGKAYREGSFLYDAGKLKTHIGDFGLQGTSFDVMIDEKSYHDIKISMPGRHQVDNAATALAAIEILRRNSIIKVTSDKIRQGMAAAFMKGRFEMIGDPVRYVLDGAHNANGAERLADNIRDLFHGRKILFVMGVLSDKDADSMTGSLATAGRKFIATEPPNPRKLEAGVLCRKIRDTGAECVSCPDLSEAVHKAVQQENDFDIIVFTGSLYMIGDIRRMLLDES